LAFLLFIAALTLPATAVSQQVTPDVNADGFVQAIVPETPIAVQPSDPNVLVEQDSAKKPTEAERKKALEALNKKIETAHKPLFFNNDFSYVCDANYNDWLLGDRLKRNCLPGGGYYDVGGQYRMRGQVERNMRGLGLTGVDDEFLLHRTRIYGDFHLSPNIRVFAELLDAQSVYENFAPRTIEVNRADMQNLFVDAKLFDTSNGELTARIGRQELLYGAQRTVSPLDWANTRRNFEGAMLTWKKENWTMDGFWTNPIRVDDDSFDSPDRDQEFMGLYSTRKLSEHQTVDAYFLRYLNRRGPNDFEFNTLGMRSQGDRDGLLWEFEGAYQFGENTDGSDHNAGMTTLGLGRKLADERWQPTLWAYYDWASGGNTPGDGNGFHHLFPLGHKYYGFMDLYGRRNIEDFNLLLTTQPSKKLKLLAWYHYFTLATKSDSPYSIVMTPFNGANAPGSVDLGHELDFIADYKIGQRQSLILGYSKFFAGKYYATTPGVPFNGNADFFYTEWSINF
jgi:hypothetical protein